MNRSRLMLIGLAAALVLATLTFPLWRPLLVNDVVDEAFPNLNAEQLAALRQMPDDQRAVLVEMAVENAEMAQGMVAAMLTPDVVMTEEAMPDTPAVLAAGLFVQIDAIHGATGTATIYTLADGSHVLRFEDFRATNGPDLHVYLARHPEPRNHDDLGTDYFDLGQLKGNVGSQNYNIPADAELSLFQSVVIYCVPFQVVFSTATL